MLWRKLISAEGGKSMNDHGDNDLVQLSDLIDVRDPAAVFKEVRSIVRKDYPSVRTRNLKLVFDDIVRLYNGSFPGYRKCNTEYHDLTHTLGAFLALARLIDGYNLFHDTISERGALLGLIGALMHDTGYIQRDDDSSGTGAKYTLQRIRRSIEFMRMYTADNDFGPEETAFCEHCILSTNINTGMNDIIFSGREEEVVGKMLGIADLLSQISDRNYLEKLILLYMEFLEGKVDGFESELDLYRKTIRFFSSVQKRFGSQMDGLDNYMIHHFRMRWNIDHDLYRRAIEKNADYLRSLMGGKQVEIHNYLRRGGVPELVCDTGNLPNFR